MWLWLSVYVCVWLWLTLCAWQVPATDLFNRDYQNRVFNASIKVLSLSDARTRFLAVDVSQAGGVNDADAWIRSPIRADLEQKLQPKFYQLAQEVGVPGHMERVPLHIVKDHIFPHRKLTQQNWSRPAGKMPNKTPWKVAA